LQEGEIRRVGANQTLKVDVRAITASNRDIENEVRQGRFRQDLMYRLNAVTIHLPPLRERVEDIPLLAEHFAETARPPGLQPVKFSSSALKLLQEYHWEGNVRELENAVLHAVSMCDNVVHPEHLPAHVQWGNKTAPDVSSGAAEASLPPGERKWLSLDEMEAKYVAQVLAHTGGNKQAASRILGIDRKTLTRILNRAA
jgi:two-component system, NtrC family, response regulator AtoC